MAGPARLPLPRRRPNYRFGFTAFADTMFQLLIFFILSSNLTPYALITLKTAPAISDTAGTGGTAPEPGPASPVAPPEIALWTVEPGGLVVGGQSFAFDKLPALAAALGSEAAPADVVLILGPAARVQDVATVLAALQAAHVESVRITSEDG